MRWVTRGLWVAAWGVWGLFAWRLASELPRNLGAPLGHLPASEFLSVAGILEGGDAVVGEHLPGIILQERMQSLDCWRTPSGEKLATVGPFRASRWTPEQPWISLRHGVVAETNVFVDRKDQVCNVWNLRNGQVQALPAGLTRILDFHPLHRWAAVSVDENVSNSRIAAVDLDSGVIVKEWNLAPEKLSLPGAVRAGFFIDDGSLMIVLSSRDTLLDLYF